MKLEYDHLLGLDYVPGQVHCFSLVRRFYQDNFGIDIPNFAVPTDWDSNKLDLINQIYSLTPFQKLAVQGLQLRPGDLLCTAVRSCHANHFLIDVGNNEILHHPLHQKSTVDPMRSFWRSATLYVLRHPDVPDLTPQLPDVTLKELNRDRYQVQAR